MYPGFIKHSETLELCRVTDPVSLHMYFWWHGCWRRISLPLMGRLLVAKIYVVGINKQGIQFLIRWNLGTYRFVTIYIMISQWWKIPDAHIYIYMYLIIYDYLCNYIYLFQYNLGFGNVAQITSFNAHYRVQKCIKRWCICMQWKSLAALLCTNCILYGKYFCTVSYLLIIYKIIKCKFHVCRK